ncbi:hypothetical protein BLOT_002304 [Blomia tropicalis]|nr:hypothetical protein BLOT_002304 [Blomia tropicalis]
MMNNQSAMSLTPCRKKNSLMADGEGGSGGGDNEHFVIHRLHKDRMKERSSENTDLMIYAMKYREPFVLKYIHKT